MSHPTGATYFVFGESGRLMSARFKVARRINRRVKVVKVLKVFKGPKDFFLRERFPYSATLFTEARIFLYSIGVTLMNSRT